MRSAVNVVNNISDVLASDKEPGDPDNVITYDEVTLIVSTTQGWTGNTTKIYTAQGQMLLPASDQLFGSNNTPSCLDKKVSN